ncbi:MAG: hypothetical protein CVU00_11060 [Bacteroidetes bacterium HGW-Bacteroidetes-17]|jgi:DNA-binding beta-propeller fold protein YncE|nr:MAG: hypothetical protein CVU00_11060 [Bacteroidetes bacterium HGW-Bacteroidetes-17]
MKTKLIPIITLILILFLSACKKDKVIIEETGGIYSNGAFISNEGTFGLGNSSISFLDFNTDIVTNDIFNSKNDRPLGDVLQSIKIMAGNLYCVVNASNKIEIVKADDFTETGVIEGLDNPRYIAAENNKLYVSQWGNGGQIKVFDPFTNILKKTIDVGTGPEGILAYNYLIWVANGGGFLVDSTISLIDPWSDELIANIKVGHNPKEMVVDADGNVWVICSGYVQYDENWNIVSESPSKLVKISGFNFEILSEIEISKTSHPQHIDISKNRETIYYGGGYGFAGIHAVYYSNSEKIQSIGGDKYFYGFNINPDNDDIYGLEAPSFSDNGILYRYDKLGTFVKQYEVGIGPNSAVFW